MPSIYEPMEYSYELIHLLLNSCWSLCVSSQTDLWNACCGSKFDCALVTSSFSFHLLYAYCHGSFHMRLLLLASWPLMSLLYIYPICISSHTVSLYLLSTYIPFYIVFYMSLVCNCLYLYMLITCLPAKNHIPRSFLSDYRFDSLMCSQS